VSDPTPEERRRAWQARWARGGDPADPEGMAFVALVAAIRAAEEAAAARERAECEALCYGMVVRETPWTGAGATTWSERCALAIRARGTPERSGPRA
jgi:hypothetical protein